MGKKLTLLQRKIAFGMAKVTEIKKETLKVETPNAIKVPNGSKRSH